MGSSMPPVRQSHYCSCKASSWAAKRAYAGIHTDSGAIRTSAKTVNPRLLDEQDLARRGKLCPSRKRLAKS